MDKSFELRNSKLSEISLKKGDRSGDLKKHGIDRVFNNLTVRSLASLKNEVDKGMRLHAHISTTTETVEGYPCDFCAVFYFNIGQNFLNGENGWHGDFEQGGIIVNCDFEAVNISRMIDDWDEAMFVGIINITKKRQCRILCPIRLQALNVCPLGISQPVDSVFPDVLGGISFEKVFRIPDRELDIFSEGRVFEQPELPEQMVESRPEVVANISNEQRKFRRDGFKLLKPEHAISCLSVSFDTISNSVGLSINKPLHQFVYSIDMISCSADFEKRAIKRMHMLEYPYGEESEKDTKDSQRTRDIRAHKRRVVSKEGNKGI
jgi:hypothetical protein